MTNEELLNPRVICIGGELGKQHYPYSEFLTGQILTLSQSGVNYRPENGSPNMILAEIVDQFPKLFRKMPWHEARKPEDMPRYLRYTGNLKTAPYKNNEILKVIDWKDDETNECRLYFIYENDPNGDLGWYPDSFIPATEEEYLKTA